jgi:hypothetical protein
MTALITTDQVRALQATRRRAGIDDDAWHARLVGRYGVTSIKALTIAQANAELDSLNGARPAARKFRPSDKPYVRKVFALWTEAAKVGAIHDKSKPALRAFVGRQLRGSAGNDPAKVARDPEFLTPEEANKVSEGLKAMIRRAKGE